MAILALYLRHYVLTPLIFLLKSTIRLTAFNDAFAFFLNGENIALLPDGETQVTINNVNHFVNTEYFIGNDISEELGIQYPKIEADGFTTTLVAKGVPNSVDDGNDVRCFMFLLSVVIFCKCFY